MALREIYEGSIHVSREDYVQVEMTDEDLEEVPIPDLDAYVTRKTKLTFTLEYPFERPFHGVVVGNDGITLRMIIDAVRAGFRTMYRGTSVTDIPNLHNKLVDGAYGRACHVIDDLVIALVTLDDERGELDVEIDS
jgi:hypothetical protein